MALLHLPLPPKVLHLCAPGYLRRYIFPIRKTHKQFLAAQGKFLSAPLEMGEGGNKKKICVLNIQKKLAPKRTPARPCTLLCYSLLSIPSESGQVTNERMPDFLTCSFLTCITKIKIHCYIIKEESSSLPTGRTTVNVEFFSTSRTRPLSRSI